MTPKLPRDMTTDAGFAYAQQEEQARDLIARLCREVQKPTWRPLYDWPPFARAHFFRREARDRAALAAVQETLWSDPQSPLARALLFSLVTRGIHRVQLLRHLSDEWPSLDFPRLYLGHALMRVGRYEEALAYLEAYASRFPKDPWPYPAIGLITLARRDSNRAREAAALLEANAGTSFVQHRTAARFYSFARDYQSSFAIAWRVALRLRGWRARLFPLVLPFVVATRTQYRALTAVTSLCGLLSAFLASKGQAYVPVLSVFVSLFVLRVLARFTLARETIPARVLHDWKPP